jgi:hypothetical protein
MKPENYARETEMTAPEQRAWSKIEGSFRSARPAEPREGFGSRWLSVEKKSAVAEQKRREHWLMLGNITAILVLLGVIGIILWSFFREPNSLSNLFSLVIKGMTDFVIAVRLWISSHHNFSLIAWLSTGWIYVVVLSAISLLAVMLANLGEVSMAREEVVTSESI